MVQRDCKETFDAANKETGNNSNASGKIGVETHCTGAKSMIP